MNDFCPEYMKEKDPRTGHSYDSCVVCHHYNHVEGCTHPDNPKNKM